MRGVYDRRKRPSENVPIEWDFATELAKVPGDAIALATVTVKDTSGNDTSGAMLVSTSVVGTVVQAWVDDGAAGTDYLVDFKITCASGARWENDVLVQVKPDA